MFLPLTLHNPVPSHTWNCQQIVDQRLKVLRLFRIKFVDVDPTDSLWTPGPNQGCSGGGWEKIGQEGSGNEASKYWAAESEKKSEGSSKLKEGRCVTGPLVHWMNVGVVFFFFAIFSLAMHFFCFQNKVAHGERSIFCLQIHGWSAKVTRLHCMMILMSNWLKCALHTVAKQAIQRKNDSVRDRKGLCWEFLWNIKT